MTAYDDNPRVSGDYVWVTADDTAGRHSRAAQVTAAKRAYERDHGVTLTLIAKNYSETYGFLHRSAFRYEIGRPGQVFRLRYASVNGGVYDARETFPTMAAAKAHVPPAFRTLSAYVRVWIIGPDGRQSQTGVRTVSGGSGYSWYFEPVDAAQIPITDAQDGKYHP